MEENRTWSGADSQDREFHRCQEYSQDDRQEFGRMKRQQPGQKRDRSQVEEEEKRKKKWNKISRYLLGTASGVVLIVSASAYEAPAPVPVIELTQEEKLFLKEVQQEFMEDDFDGVLGSLTGQEVRYTPDERIEVHLENHLAEIYLGLSEKAAWKQEDRLAILMEDDISVVPAGDGTGFCMDGGKLFYGQLKDGLPDGEGTCYEVIHNYYEYSQGEWKEGYANGGIISYTAYFEDIDDQTFVCEQKTTEGRYTAGIADGTVTLNFDTLSTSDAYDYGEDAAKRVSYEVRDGQIVIDEQWRLNEYDRYVLYDEAGKRFVEEFDKDYLKWLVNVSVEWLPVEN